MAKRTDAAHTEGGGLHNKTVGWLVAQMVRCGKPNCRCACGDLHGPYFVRGWREGGDQHRRYVPLAEVEGIRRELAEAAVERERVRAAWAQYRGLRDLLREVR